MADGDEPGKGGNEGRRPYPLWRPVLAAAAATLLPVLWWVAPFLVAYGQPFYALLTGAAGGIGFIAISPVMEAVLLHILLHDWRLVRWSGRIGRLVLLGALPALFALSCVIPRSVPFDLGVKARVNRAGGIVQLQDWAVKVVAAESARPSTEEVRELDEFPEHVHRLRPTWDMVAVDTREGVVLIQIGGRDMSSQLVVGDRTFRPSGGLSRQLVRLYDGVYLCRGRTWEELRAEGKR